MHCRQGNSSAAICSGRHGRGSPGSHEDVSRDDRARRSASRAHQRCGRARRARRGLPGLVLSVPLRRGGPRLPLGRPPGLDRRGDPRATSPTLPSRSGCSPCAPRRPGTSSSRRATDGSVEIAYFGLLPEFIGRGYGKHLLTEAVERAWSAGARRVWLHTCSLDDPAALPNYRARGFRPFREETYSVTAPS